MQIDDDRKGAFVHFSSSVSKNNKKVVIDTLNDVMRATEKNKEFFYGLLVEAYGWWEESEEFANISHTADGFVKNSLFNDHRIMLRTNLYPEEKTGFKLKRSHDGAVVKKALLHEIGHLFDYYFATPDKDIKDELRSRMFKDRENFRNEEFFKLLDIYESQNGLSDSEEFKKAWRADIETTFKGKDEKEISGICSRLLYYSPLYKNPEMNPNKQVNIKLEDGIDDKELADADKVREEISPGSFSLAA